MTPLGDQLNESSTTGPMEAIRQLCTDAPIDDQREGTRRHPRKRFSAVVDYAAQGHAYRDFIKDIGPGGIFIETAIPFSVGQELSLTFALPSYRTHIKITGQIVWTGPRGIGVKFTVPKERPHEMPRREGAERRRHPRFPLTLAAFALLSQPLFLVGEILDMSMGGLSFRCSSEAEIPEEAQALDIICAQGGPPVGKVLFTPVTELSFSKEEMRYGVRFGRLTTRQTSQLKAFIQIHSGAAL